MNTKERLKSYCKSVGLTVKEFEVSIGASNGYVNSISKGIGEDKLSIIIEKFPNLSIEWLLTGKGKMLKEEEVTEVEDSYYKELYFEMKKEYTNVMGHLEQVTKDQRSIIESQKFLIEKLSNMGEKRD